MQISDSAKPRMCMKTNVLFLSLSCHPFISWLSLFIAPKAPRTKHTFQKCVSKFAEYFGAITRTINLRQGISAFAIWRTGNHFLLCSLIGVKCSPYKCCPQALIKQITSHFQHWIFSSVVFWTLFEWDDFQMHSILCPSSQNSITLWLLHALTPSSTVTVRSFWLQVKNMGAKWL